MMKKKIEIIIPVCLLFFMCISILSIYSSTTILSSSYSSLFIKQASWYLIAFIMLGVILYIGNKQIFKYSKYIYYLGLFFLVLVLIIGKTFNSSTAWIDLGFFNFQPSEFMKIGLILYLSNITYEFTILNKKSIKKEIEYLVKMFILTIVPSILVFIEPDTGAVIMYIIIMFMLIIMSNIRKRWLISIIIISLIMLITLSFLYTYNHDLFINIFGSDMYYRIYRFVDWSSSSGMQLENSMIAIGSSGLSGHGYLNTPIYFPEPSTDFIFSIYASNFGFIATICLLLIILLFDLEILRIGFKTKSIVNKYIVISILSLLLYSQIQNISMTIGILPITGIPLPFISYGGSSLITYMILIGFVLNIAKNK